MDDWVLAANHDGYWLQAGGRVVAAQIGRGGVIRAADKHEGDGATPCGRWPVRAVYYRPDRVQCPETILPCHRLTIDCGWCDDVRSSLYNMPIERPSATCHERLWRHDRLYDLFFELGMNDAPPERGAGSAIFLHLEKDNFRATLGCIAVNHATMQFLLRHANPTTHIAIAES